MPIQPSIPVVQSFTLTTDFQEIYQVEPSILRFSIDAIVVNNYSDSSASVWIRITTPGGGADADEIVTERAIRAKENFLAPGAIGQGVLTGSVIEAKASVNDALSIRITGTKIS